MIDYPHKLQTDLLVIGVGLAGLAAGAFASYCGLRTILVGISSSGVLLASGLLDLLGIYPVEEQRQWHDPWQAVGALIEGCPAHPYARLGVKTIRAAWSEFLAVLESAGLRYVGWPARNAVLATSIGTLKSTYRVPETMWPGVAALQQKPPTLIVDFEGMKDFSARQMVETLGIRWSGLRALRLKFPCYIGDIDRSAPVLAQAMESPEVRTTLAATIRSGLKGAEFVGLPAIFGTRRAEVIAADLHRQVGVPVFEIPTLPPSVPGLRLKEALERELVRRGTTLFSGWRVVAINGRGHRGFEVAVEGEMFRQTVEAKGVVIASGRFLGGGLVAGRDGIREPLLNLRVHQPPTRREWHHRRLFAPGGHPVNQAGLVVDERMRPLSSEGRVAHENLFAIGSVLAHQDWVRMKCGAGLALATAYAAVRSFAGQS
jgi:glycerol-3-phosphate dehydrogenase subunit B